MDIVIPYDTDTAFPHRRRHPSNPKSTQTHHHHHFAPLHRYRPPQHLDPPPAALLYSTTPLNRVKAIRAHRAHVLSHANRATTIQRALPEPCMNHHAQQLEPAGADHRPPQHLPYKQQHSRSAHPRVTTMTPSPSTPPSMSAGAMVSSPQPATTTAVSSLTAEPVHALPYSSAAESRAIPASTIMPNSNAPAPSVSESASPSETHVRFDSAVVPDIHGDPLPNTVSHFSAASATAGDNAATLKTAARQEYHQARSAFNNRQVSGEVTQPNPDLATPPAPGLLPARRSVESAKHAVAAVSLQVDHVKEKTRQSIYEFALSRIDTLEDEEFSWPHLRQNLERLFGSIQPLPDFAFFVYDVLMWTQPLKTAFFLGVYLVALCTGRLMLTIGVVLAITLVYYGITQERVLAGMGLRCLYLDAQRQPAFADKSHTQHIEDRANESSLATLANPETSPLHVSNLPSMVGKAITGGGGGCEAANKKKGAAETWSDIKDKVLPVLQLQTRDTADLAEKVYNMITWKRPKATLMSIVHSGMLVLLLHSVPSMVLHRMIGLLIGVNIFVLVPLQLKFPRYRRMFSINHVLMWPFPTHAEWAIEQLAKATQPQVTMVQYPIDNNTAGTSSSTTANDLRNEQQPGNRDSTTSTPSTTTTTARVDHFPCSFNGHSGTLVVRAGGRDLEFVSTHSTSSLPIPRASRMRRNVMLIPMQDIVRIRKSMDRALWVLKNYQLEVNLRSGETLVFDNVQRRDEAFGLLAAASSDPRRLWRVPGT